MSDDQPGEARYADDGHRYRLDTRIATGGMGEVWRGTDTTLGREVAVKLLKDEYADDASFRTRFQTEAQHAASLHHPNIAAVYDFGEAGAQRPYLVMELVDGQPLSALLRPGVPMDPVAVRELLAQAADGLGAAHAAGIVHRDIKPANLLVTPDRQVKVTDFGIARAAEGLGLTQTGEVMGTPQYLSPEQAQGQTATPASDVYSLGVVAFECLAGRRPYVADTAVATALAHLREPVPDLPDAVPGDLAVVVRRAMSKLPQDRFADGAALAAALRDPATAATHFVPAPAPVAAETAVLPAMTTPAPAPGPAPVTAATRPGGGRRPWLWALLGVAVLVLVALLAFLVFAQGAGDDQPDERPPHTPKHSRTPSSSSPAQPSSSAPPPSSSAPPSESTTPSSPTSAPTSASTSAPTSTSPSDTPSTSAPASPTDPASSGATGAATGAAGVDSSGTPAPTTSTSPSSQGEVDGR